MTPKCSASLPAAQSNWLGGLEVPRWVSRLGSGLLPSWAWGVAPKSIDGEPGNSPATTPWPGFSFEILHHPARQTYQLKRYRQKCSGNWEASWGGSRLQRSRTLLPFVMSWMARSEAVARTASASESRTQQNTQSIDDGLRGGDGLSGLWGEPSSSCYQSTRGSSFCERLRSVLVYKRCSLSMLEWCTCTTKTS